MMIAHGRFLKRSDPRHKSRGIIYAMTRDTMPGGYKPVGWRVVSSYVCADGAPHRAGKKAGQ
jgi:hypothetical protein